MDYFFGKIFIRLFFIKLYYRNFQLLYFNIIMSSQIFKNNIPNEMFFGLLDSMCLKNEKHYTLTIDSFKKGVFKDTIPQFIEICKPYYHLSKHRYLERKLTYKSFTTILRQICNANKITYTSQIKYDKSIYNIVYYIYI